LKTLAIHAALRHCLGQSFLELPAGTRSSIQAPLGRRLGLVQDPILVLAFYLSPVRLRAPALEWAVLTLPTIQGLAVDVLSGGDANYSLRLCWDLASFLTFVEELPAAFPGRDMHPVLWWALNGKAFPTLRFVALWIVSFPLSGAGGEQTFKTSQHVHTDVRNRPDPAKADIQTIIAFKSGQLARWDIVASCGRLYIDYKLLKWLGLAAVTAIPAAPPAPGGGNDNAEEEGHEAEIEGVALAALEAIVERVVNGKEDE